MKAVIDPTWANFSQQIRRIVHILYLYGIETLFNQNTCLFNCLKWAY